MPSKIDISHKSILFTIIFLILLWFLIRIKEIIFLIYVAFILMTALKPLVDKLEQYRIPRVIGALITYIIILVILIFAGSALLPPLITQTIRLGESLPGYVNSFQPFIKIDVQTIVQQVTPLGENLLKVTLGVFNNVISVFTLIVISFYMLIERKNLESHLSGIVGDEGSKKIIIILHRIEERLGSWVLGQISLGFTIGLATFIGLLLFNLPFALPLAIFAGIMEIVPIIGPIISAIPAILAALTISPILALAVAALYFIIQQLEAQLVVPFVMRKAVGIPPLVTIIALLTGAQLAGIGGALLAVPVVVTLEVFLSEYIRLKEKNYSKN